MTDARRSRLRHPARRLAGRAGWAFADQGVSSLTNFVLGVLVARTTTAEGFGAFSIAFSTYLIALNLARASGTQPLVIRYSGAAVDRWRSGVRSAVGTMLAAGVAGGAIFMVVGAVLGDDVGLSFVALGVALPALLMQDAWRFAFFAGGRDRAALATDVAWALSLVPILWLTSTMAPGAPPAILAWGTSALIGSVVGMRLAGVLPDPTAARRWLNEHRDLAGRYSLEVIIGLTAGQIPIYVVGLTAGLAEAGSIRAAQLLLGPMHVVLQAVHLIAVPEGVRIREREPRRFPTAMIGFGVGLGAVIGAWVVLLMLVPDWIGEALLGDSWAAAALVLLPLGLALVGQGIAGGGLVGLRVLADAVRSLRARTVDSIAGVILAVAGALLAGAIGASWALALSGFLGAAIFTLAFMRSVRASAASGRRIN